MMHFVDTTQYIQINNEHDHKNALNNAKKYQQLTRMFDVFQQLRRQQRVYGCDFADKMSLADLSVFVFTKKT